MKVLVTGFDPFGGEKVNPAIESVKRLPSEILGAEIVKEEIPTVFRRSHEVLKTLIEKHAPQVVLCVGQAGGRSHITVERVAINVMDASIKDNDGMAPIDEPIVVGGPAAYFSNLPIKAMVHHMKNHRIPASISNSAGTFVCNHIMYAALYESEQRGHLIRAGFIHIPFLPEQVLERPGVASMALDDIVKGLTHAVEAIITHQEDLKEMGGTIC